MKQWPRARSPDSRRSSPAMRPDVVGPVRSARLIDLELVPEYSALLADSGSSEGVTAALESAPDIPNINDSAFHDAAYWRVDDRVAPHNLMTSTAGIRKAAADCGPCA